MTAGQQLPAGAAAAAANETLAAADVKLLDRGKTSDSGDGSAVRRGAAATANQLGSRWAASGLGFSNVGRMAALWALVVGVLILVLFLRRRVWRKLAPRGRLYVRTQRSNVVSV